MLPQYTLPQYMLPSVIMSKVVIVTHTGTPTRMRYPLFPVPPIKMVSQYYLPHQFDDHPQTISYWDVIN